MGSITINCKGKKKDVPLTGFAHVFNKMKNEFSK